MREQRKEDLDKHVAAVNEELRKQNADVYASDSGDETNGDATEWNGIDDATPGGDPNEDAEYVDEDKYTTVTVEAMDTLGEESEDNAATREASKADDDANGVIKKRARSKDPSKIQPKKKKLKFRYESKAERQATRQKQKTKSRAAKARRKGS